MASDQPLSNGIPAGTDIAMPDVVATAPAEIPPDVLPGILQAAATPPPSSTTSTFTTSQIPPNSSSDPQATGQGFSTITTPSNAPTADPTMPVSTRSSSSAQNTLTASSTAAAAAAEKKEQQQQHKEPVTPIMSLPATRMPNGAQTRVYLNEKVTPHLLEVMKEIAIKVPDKPLAFMAEFLAERSKAVEGE